MCRKLNQLGEVLCAFAKNVAFRFEQWRSPVFKGALPASANDCRELEEQAARSTSQQLKPSLVNSLNYAKGAFGHTFRIFQVVCRFALQISSQPFGCVPCLARKFLPSSSSKDTSGLLKEELIEAMGRTSSSVGLLDEWKIELCSMKRNSQASENIHVHVALINLDHKIS